MENEAEFDEIEIVSKTQLKRQSHEIQELGKRLVKLSPDQLATIALDQPVLEAITLAHKIQNKRGALKRHYQFLGKLLRARDTDVIFSALTILDQSSRVSIQLHHRAERWRDKIIETGNSAIDELIEEAPGADRQKLRQILRNFHNTVNESKKVQNARLIYQEIKQALAN